jgi:four helix bundle protein
MKIRTHKDLEVFQVAFKAAMEIFDISRGFPKEEIYSLTDQIRRSSRSVCGNIAEAFRKRRYPKAFISKLSDCEGEAGETQTWIDFAHRCGYVSEKVHQELFVAYENIIGELVTMSLQADKWKW